MMLLMLKLGIRCYLWQFYEDMMLPIPALGGCYSVVFSANNTGTKELRTKLDLLLMSSLPLCFCRRNKSLLV